MKTIRQVGIYHQNIAKLQRESPQLRDTGGSRRRLCVCRRRRREDDDEDDDG